VNLDGENLVFSDDTARTVVEWLCDYMLEEKDEFAAWVISTDRADWLKPSTKDTGIPLDQMVLLVVGGFLGGLRMQAGLEV
jgi:hypothetical protein